MKRILTLLLILLSISHTADAIYFNRLGVREGLPHISILSIYQDELGVMWFGTVEGICRYNGKQTTLFTSSDQDTALTHNSAYSITGNKNGALYIRALYDLIRYDIASEKFACLRQGDVKAIYHNGDKLWYCTETMLCYFDEPSGRHVEYMDISSGITDASALYVTENRTIIIGSANGLSIIFPSDNRRMTKVLDSVYVNAIFTDSRYNIWVGTEGDGIILLDRQGHTIDRFRHSSGENSLSNDQVRSFIEDNDGRIWAGTFFGLNCYDTITRRWEKYIHADDQPSSLSHSSVFSIYCDEQKTIWVGTYFGGVNYFNPETNVFKYYGASSHNADYLSFPFVSKMTEDDGGNLWICTEGGGLNRLDLQTRKFTRYLYSGYDLESVFRYNMKCICYVPERQKLYIGIHNGGLCIFDLRTNTSRILTHRPSDRNSLPHNVVNDLQYYNGELIFVTPAGLWRMNLDTERFAPFSDLSGIRDALTNTYNVTFKIDSKDNLWMPLSSGVVCINLQSNQSRSYQHHPGSARSIGKSRIVNIEETASGDIFFATAGSGLYRYRPQSDDFESYTMEENTLRSNYCYFAKELPSGNLLLLHNDGISVFDPRNPDNTTYRSGSNFPIASFFQGSSVYITRENEIFIGGVNGMVSVFENQLVTTASDKYSLFFDRLYVNNNQISPGDETGILRQALSLTSEIWLKHYQSSVAIEFASSNYIQDVERSYEYILYGFDKNWTPLTSQTIVYTNILPGKYVLKIRTRSDGRSSGEVKSCRLEIVVQPPYYLSPLAYVIYAILIFSLIYGVIWFFAWKSRVKAELEIERREKEHNEELNRTKLKFFTSISHELRTPLTLIIGQAETVISESARNTKMRDRVSRIHRNAVDMRNLISELLDFRKQEQGFNKLRVEQVDMVEYLREIYDTFSDNAARKSISYNFEPEEDGIMAYIDPRQFYKVIYNLLSNAFKYTDRQGDVTMRILQQRGHIIIQVQDNGTGIPAESISRIFERFYQVEFGSSELGVGTGIGLALAKEIVEHHKGSISVSSTVDEGSIFEIVLQTGSAHFSDDELADSASISGKFIIPESTGRTETMIPHRNNAHEGKEEFQTPSENLNDDRPVILIVEDNAELLELLSEYFSGSYSVHTAVNGKQGLEKTLAIHPDIIVSDVMMPEMSGKQMCYRIKNNVNISHIPVVLLTAQATTEQTIEGYMYGADEYIIKPFNLDLLMARCNNLINSRRQLYSVLAGQKERDDKTGGMNDHDRKFLDMATGIIRDNFDNPDFDMDRLAGAMGLGRNKLYSKIKKITGLTPNEYTLSVKFREATDLLENSPQLNVSDIAYYLGFSSVKYFSKCFKTFYGVSPQQWRKEKGGKNDNATTLEID